MVTERASDLIKATIAMYGDCARKATKALLNNWVILVASLVCFFVLMGSSLLFGSMQLIGDMIVNLISIALLTLYFSWLSILTNRHPLTKEDLLDFDTSLFFALIGVSFVIWVLSWGVQTLTSGLNASWLIAFLRLAIVVLCNALAEVVYIRRQESLQAFQEAFTFTRENWIEWFLPFLVVVSPILVVAGFSSLPLLLAGTYPLLPASPLFTVPQYLLPGEAGFLGAALGLVLATWFMIFRGFLFRELGTGSRRSRAFKARQS